jgi:uncharacterized protein (DUF1697 family)
MNTYIALLRGINVSGQKTIKMSGLVKHMENTGFHNVSTYIQSGNIIFQHTNKDVQYLERLIFTMIKKEYGFEVQTCILTASVLSDILQKNPYATDPDKVYFTFLSDEPDITKLRKIPADKFLPEQFVVYKKVIISYFPDGYGRAKMNNNFFENKLKVFATTRNFKTVKKLLEMTSAD